MAVSSLERGVSHEKRSSLREALNSQKNEGVRKIDPEIEEVKGFMELGFEFRKDDLNPRVMDLVPGLKHLEKINVKAREERQQDSVAKLRCPGVMKEEDMKQLLKLWARSVASTLL